MIIIYRIICRVCISLHTCFTNATEMEIYGNILFFDPSLIVKYVTLYVKRIIYILIYAHATGTIIQIFILYHLYYLYYMLLYVR